MSTVDRIVQALKSKPDLLWEVYKHLSNLPVVAPWEKEGGVVFRPLLSGGRVATLQEDHKGWRFEVSFTRQPRDLLRGTAKSLREAMEIADLALKEDGAFLVGGIPPIAEPWVRIHESEWRRAVSGKSPNTIFQRASEIVGGAGGELAVYVQDKQLPETFREWEHAANVADNVLQEEGWWLL